MEIPLNFETRIAESQAAELVPAIGVVWVGPSGNAYTAMLGKLPRDPIPRWHLGSCTKALTATLIARLVDQGRISFDATLAEALPDMAAQMSLAFRETPIHALLTHSAGVVRDVQTDAFEALHHAKTPVIEQRRSIVAETLSDDPRSDGGYSNVGYVILGAVIEKITGTSWEMSLQREVFDPLGIASFGFGGLGAKQLSGHLRAGEIWWPFRGDNPEAYGPAGRVSLSLSDWGYFLNAHLRPGTFLDTETLRRLHTAAHSDYAMGWRREEASGDPILTHAGSNTAWFAQATLVSARGIALGVVCNAFDQRVEKAVGDLTRDLLASKAV